MSDPDQAPTGDQPALKKALTPKLLLLFIVGDILGTGVYALTGEVAGEVGGAGWLPIIIAFAVAMVSALSYVEMVTKYADAAGAALLLGSTAQRVVMESPSPVVLVKPPGFVPPPRD